MSRRVATRIEIEILLRKAVGSVLTFPTELIRMIMAYWRPPQLTINPDYIARNVYWPTSMSGWHGGEAFMFHRRWVRSVWTRRLHPGEEHWPLAQVL